MRIVAAAVLACLSLQGAHAAEMKVGRSENGKAIIAVVGQFMPDDGQRFATAASGLDEGVVVFASPGGNLMAGLRIGQFIRLHKLSTLVPDGEMCASACALAWLGGTRRFMQPTARLGFHAAYVRDGRGVTRVSGVGNALVGAYLGRLGLDEAAITFMGSADPDGMRWMTQADAARLGIEVTTLASVKREPEPERTAPPAEPRFKDRSAVAASFVDSYFAHWSETNADALAFFRSAYFQRVEFYGQPIPLATVMEQKAGFAQRWPERIYAVRTGSVRSICTAQGCDVSGVVDWDARNAALGRRSAGSAAFQLKVAFQAGQPLIVAESGRVLSREPDDPTPTRKE